MREVVEYFGLIEVVEPVVMGLIVWAQWGEGVGVLKVAALHVMADVKLCFGFGGYFRRWVRLEWSYFLF
jgi:hypothetical protein